MHRLAPLIALGVFWPCSRCQLGRPVWFRRAESAPF